MPIDSRMVITPCESVGFLGFKAVTSEIFNIGYEPLLTRDTGRILVPGMLCAFFLGNCISRLCKLA